MKTNQEYKSLALAALKGSWPQAIVATSIVLAISALSATASWYLTEPFSYVVPLLIGVVAMPFVVGYANAFSRMFYMSDYAILKNVKEMTFEDGFRKLAGMFLMSLVTLLYTVALVVPGVIASLSLFLTPYLLQDYPEKSLVEVMRTSKAMMQGHKMQLFKLQLGFIGWMLLNVLTLGIGSLWLFPYMMTAMAAFYQDVREQYIMKEDLQESAL